ncbi:sugar transferase [Vibrio sp. S4M6]|uniref:sugar transferase n=1 Tax=Vibrio sinus TaxID=2946865 RepID=UPI00202A3067|nr:sugar transferase [Vibrio sinus]MCL9780372.1 sugar transferase [Vibrio sinus]
MKNGGSVIRVLDVLLALLALLCLWPVFLIIYILGLLDTGAPIFRQERVGKNLTPFTLVKFRTMPKSTKSVATHLVEAHSVTKVGRVLRKTKLDELPQLINVIKGDMSLVGPRPNLFNQEELIKERKAKGIYSVPPGITGLAQIQKIDMSRPKLLTQVDKEMVDNLTIMTYFKIIWHTICGKGSGDTVK